MKRIIIAAFLAVSFSGYAQDVSRHGLRFGVGDMMSETARWHNQVHRDYSSIADGISKPEDVNFFYTPHISAEYSYRALDWLSLGLTGDFQSTSWDRKYYNNQDIVTGVTRENFYNLSFFLNIRFNYFTREHVGLYSSLAPGFDINGGSETDCFGRHTTTGFAFDLRLIGVTAGKGQYWGFAELGLMAAMKNADSIFLFGSQLVKAGFTYKFKLN